MPLKGEQSSVLKRARGSAGDTGKDSKKPRRSDRISSQHNTTPLKATAQLPSPQTHQSDGVEAYRDRRGTETPPEGRPSQINHRSPISPPRQAISSPPQDTQPLSQWVLPNGSKSRQIDEEEEDVWGYLIPLDESAGDTLVLRKRFACPIPAKHSPIGQFGQGNRPGTKSKEDFKAQEKEYERVKANSDTPAGGYLVGRHPECDRILELPTISNRHFLLFSESKDGDTVAIIEDMSSNGTFVNEELVGRNKRRELQDNDEITILDKTRYLFRYPAHRDGSAFKQKFRIIQQLGKGHFAVVYLAAEKSSGERFAVKRFERRRGDTSKTDSLQQEIAVLMSISHPHLMCLKETFDEEDGVYLVLELAQEGELFNWIVMKQKLSEDETRKLFIQLFQGIRYLHERGIVHRDIKPENILLMDKNLSVKIADFGLAKIIGEESFTTTLCGTPSYVAPEILENTKHRRYTKAVDIWSLGVVLYICLCGFPPFSDELYTKENPYTLAQQIKSARFDYPSPYWDSVADPALDLIDKMLVVDPEKRATIDDCLEHPWLTQKPVSLTDSTDGLTGAIANLDVQRRKVTRERTLLSSLNDVELKKTVEDPTSKQKIKIYEKNKSKGTKDLTGKKQAIAQEEAPGAHRDTREFMEMGGKGDEPLYAMEEQTSVYPNGKEFKNGDAGVDKAKANGSAKVKANGRS